MRQEGHYTGIVPLRNNLSLYTAMLIAKNVNHNLNMVGQLCKPINWLTIQLTIFSVHSTFKYHLIHYCNYNSVFWLLNYDTSTLVVKPFPLFAVKVTRLLVLTLCFKVV